jgi:hypothetical protein
MQFAKNVEVNWQEEWVLTMPDPIHPDKPRREFKELQWELLEHPLLWPELGLL